LMFVPSAITWLFVSTSPSALITIPVPAASPPGIDAVMSTTAGATAAAIALAGPDTVPVVDPPTRMGDGLPDRPTAATSAMTATTRATAPTTRRGERGRDGRAGPGGGGGGGEGGGGGGGASPMGGPGSGAVGGLVG